MRIKVDTDLCQGHGVCESEAPALFTVSKAGQLTVLDAAPGADQADAARRAVKFCPTGALKIEEDES